MGQISANTNTNLGFISSFRTSKNGVIFPVASFCGTGGLAPWGLNLTQGGVGYASAPTVGFTGGGGSSAAATAILGNANTSLAGVVVGLSLTNPGTGYTSAPVVTFTGGTPTTAATATALLDTTASITASGAVITAYGASASQNGGGMDVHSFENILFYVNLLTMAATSYTFKVQTSPDNGLTWQDLPASGYVSGSAPAAISSATTQNFGINSQFGIMARLFTTISGSGATAGWVVAVGR